jgi:hypothetical protein
MPAKREIAPENLAFHAPLEELQKVVDFMRTNRVTELTFHGTNFDVGLKLTSFNAVEQDSKVEQSQIVGIPVPLGHVAPKPLPNESPEDYTARAMQEQEKAALEDLMWSSGT